MLMNVRVMTPTTVTRMHSALTQRGVILALATLATLEMVSTVQVSSRMERLHRIMQVPTRLHRNLKEPFLPSCRHQ